VAYKYYYSLFRKIKNIRPHLILQRRIRVANYHKACIVLRATVKNGLRLI
jgi:15-cis-phytoene synthase